ncbi:MAG: hypothetical protein E7329_06820 [Clostridiales bacterium]|nr:hypothetical protein [Clostridiales bacterium]
MQKGKNVQYAMAGVQAMPGMRMNVHSNVRLPDGEVGYDHQEARQPYFSMGTQIPVSRRSVTVPANIGIIFLAAVFLFFGILVVGKAAQRASLTREISALETSIAQINRDNTQLAVQVMEARDSSRICYAAAQNLGMVAATGVEAVPVEAPATRPENYNGSLTGNSPSSIGHGIITGSR